MPPSKRKRATSTPNISSPGGDIGNPIIVSDSDDDTSNINLNDNHNVVRSTRERLLYSNSKNESNNENLFNPSDFSNPIGASRNVNLTHGLTGPLGTNNRNQNPPRLNINNVSSPHLPDTESDNDINIQLQDIHNTIGIGQSANSKKKNLNQFGVPRNKNNRSRSNPPIQRQHESHTAKNNKEEESKKSETNNTTKSDSKKSDTNNTTKSDSNMFKDLYNLFQASKINVVEDIAESGGVLVTVQKFNEIAQLHFPQAQYSDKIIKFATCCRAMFSCRLSETPIPQQVLLFWIIVGGSRIRCHGDIFQYNINGSFSLYEGVADFDTYTYIQEYLVNVEGAFRLVDKYYNRAGHPITERDDSTFLNYLKDAYEKLRLQNLSDDDIFKNWGGLSYASDFEFKKLEDLSWLEHIAKTTNNLSKNLRASFLDEKLAHYISDWCETEKLVTPGIAYNDTVVKFNEDEPLIQHINRSPNNNIYMSININILSNSDPVLDDAVSRLSNFYDQTYFENPLPQKAHWSCLALAIHGENIDRIEWGIGSGGVGQSLKSAHINNMMQSYHGYADTNILFVLEEMRKQLDVLSRKCILTFQERAVTDQKLLEHVYKKIASSEPMAARLPYAKLTKMLSIVGWKRLEMNSPIEFTGVTEFDINAIMRRMLVIRYKARFFEKREYNSILAADPSAPAKGNFPSDPSLKKFLQSTVAKAAGHQVLYAFMGTHTKSDCINIVEEVASDGLTESYARQACGLPEVKPQNQHEQPRDPIVAEEQRLRNLSQGLAAHILQTNTESVRTKIDDCACLGPTKPIRRENFTKLLNGNFWIPHGRSNSNKNPIIYAPNIKPAFDPSIVLAPGLADCSRVYNEVYDKNSLTNYANNKSRINNVSIIKNWYESRRTSITSSSYWSNNIATKEEHTHINKQLEKMECRERSLERLLNEISFDPPANHIKINEDGTVTAETMYEYKRQFRSRRYVRRDGAQRQSRFTRYIASKDTKRYDIKSCHIVTAIQAVDKIRPLFNCGVNNFPGASELLNNPTEVYAKFKNKRIGKELALATWNGKATNEILTNPTLRQMVNESRFMRWLSCSVFPERYAEFQQEKDRQWPEATALSHFYQIAEDACLEAMEEEIRSRCNPSHLSLEFDGIALDSSSADSIPNICETLEDGIRRRTGFNVTIVHKPDLCFLESMTSAATTSSSVFNIPSDLLKPGNCIALALWHCSDNPTAQKKVVDYVKKNPVTAPNKTKKSYSHDAPAGTRFYGRTAMAAGLLLHSVGRGLLIEDGQCGILHVGVTEPHAICIYRNNDKATVYHQKKKFVMDWQTLDNLCADAVDSSSIVTFVITQSPIPDYVNQQLLHLCAGSNDSDAESNLSDAESDNESASSHNSLYLSFSDYDTASDISSDTDSNSDYVESAPTDIISIFRKEAATHHHQITETQHRCLICPSRAFGSAAGVTHHSRIFHINENR